jgi:hypothetical protein
MPIAVLAASALAAAAVWALLDRATPRRRRAVLAAALALVAADLLVFPLRGADADPGNAGYARLGEEPSGRILELPVLPRGLGHFGSVYLGYAIQEARERPTGYSTLAPEITYDFTDRFRRLNCGAWQPGDRDDLEDLGVRFLVFHTGVFAQAGLPGTWFAWRGLQQAGYRPAGGTGPVRLFAPGEGPLAPAPVPEPDRSTPVLCDGWRGTVMVEARAMLWLFGSGKVTVPIEAPAPVTITIAVDGGEERERQLPAEDVVVDVGRPGWHLVELSAPGPGLVRAGEHLG